MRINKQITIDKGSNLQVTLNKQIATEKAITLQLAFFKSHKAKSNPYIKPGENATTGYAVVIDVKTGKVIAMASMSDYDANL
jgi:cell division protein FtsI/penicillin-binding protein 2